MKTNSSDTKQLSTSLAENFAGNSQPLETKTGVLRRLQVKLETSKAAADALARIERARIEGEEDLARTAITLSVATLKTAMVANTMPQIGALTTRLNANTAAVNQALTNGGLGETATHMNNRSENIKLFSELKREGKIDDEEEQVLISFAKADACQDIQRTRQRTEEARNAVDALHASALAGIAQSQDIVKRSR